MSIETRRIQPQMEGEVGGGYSWLGDPIRPDFHGHIEGNYRWGQESQKVNANTNQPVQEQIDNRGEKPVVSE